MLGLLGGLVGGVVSATLRTRMAHKKPTKVIIVGDERDMCAVHTEGR